MSITSASQTPGPLAAPVPPVPGAAPAAPAEVVTNIRRKAVGASMWVLIGYGSGQVIRLGSNLILTRILFPEVFGLMAMVQLVMQGLQMFSDVGIGPSIIQNPKGQSEPFRHTAFTIQVGRGVMLYVAALALTWPAAAWFQDEALISLLPASGLIAVISGFNSTKWFLIRRNMNLARVTMIEITSQIVSLVPMIVWALAYESVWALVIGGLVGAWMKMLLTHAALPGTPDGFAWDRESRQALMSFGKWIFVSTLVAFVSAKADKLLLGRLMTKDQFGVYAIAVLITAVPTSILQQMGGNIVFPAVSRRSDLPREELRRKLAKVRRPVLAAAAVGLAVLVAAGDQIVYTLWDSRYAEAGWMVSMLSLGLWPTVLWNSIGPALRAVGQPRYGALGDVLRLVILSVTMMLGYRVAGIFGLIVAVVLADLPKYAAMAYGLGRERLLVWRQDVLATLWFAAVLAALLAGRAAAGMELPFARGWS